MMPNSFASTGDMNLSLSMLDSANQKSKQTSHNTYYIKEKLYFVASTNIKVYHEKGLYDEDSFNEFKFKEPQTLIF
jgi:hypothetical protein